MWSQLITTISNFGNGILSFLSNLIGIIKALWFGLTSLLTPIWSLIVEVFDGGVFLNVGRAFNHLSGYIGGPATVFISTLLLVAVIRIGIAFVFKLLRLNIDYHSFNSQTKRWAVEDMKKKN